MIKTPKKDNYIKYAFSQTMEKLLEKRDFCDISVSEIVEASGFSRSTFYKYFRDKYELAAWEYFVHFDYTLKPEDYLDDEKSEKICNNIVAYIYSRKNYFKSVFGYIGQNSFFEYYLQLSNEVVENIAEHSGRTLSPVDYYINTYHVTGMFSVLKAWVLDDCRLGIDEIQYAISSGRSEALKKLYRV